MGEVVPNQIILGPAKYIEGLLNKDQAGQPTQHIENFNYQKRPLVEIVVVLLFCG